MEEFLRYSMAYGRRVRAILMLEGRMVQQNIVVIRYTDAELTYTSARQKTPRTVPMGSLLSLGYARGDTGEQE